MTLKLIIALIFCAAAYARTAQICNPNGCQTIDTTVIGNRNFSDYTVTNRKLINVIQRRSILATNAPVATSLCDINPFAGIQKTLPQLSWGTAVVSIFTQSFTSNGQTITNQAADLAFTNVSTSDGYLLPKFGFILTRAVGATTVFFSFRPSIDPNVQNIPGLTQDLQWVVDPVSQTLLVPDLNILPQDLQRLMLALAANLPAIYTNPTQVNIQPNSSQPVWTQAQAIQVGASTSQLIFSVPSPVFAPVTTLTCDLSPDPYTSCQETNAISSFGSFLMQAGADYLNTGNTATVQAVVGNLRSWAAAGALLTFPGYEPGNPAQDDTRIRYTLNTTITLPLAYTWGMIRLDPSVSATDRQSIDSWVNHVITFAQTPYNNKVLPDPNNHGYLQAGVRMAWAITMGDNEGFAESVERFYIALNQMNPDGSLPWEVERASCSVRYQGVAVSNLALIAELAASQGYDLYSLNVNGVSIHTALTFLLNAINNPSLVQPYEGLGAAPCNEPAGSPQDLQSLVYPNQVGDALTTAFIEQYIARFPNSPLLSELRSLLQPGGLAANRPLYNFEAGGSTTCFAMTDSLTTAVVSGPGDVLSASGGGGTLEIAATTPALAWTAESSATWLTLSSNSGSDSGAIAYDVAANPQLSVRTATITAANQVFTVTQAGATSATGPVITGIVDAATFRSVIAPGSWVSILGSNLSNTTRTWAAADFNGSQLPVQLDSVSVQIDGKPAAVSYISPGQLNVQVPDDDTLGQVTVIVMAPAGSVSGAVKLQEAIPGFFELPSPEQNYIVATHADSSLIAPIGIFPGVNTTPAKAGETIVIYGTAFGASAPPIRSGTLVSVSEPLQPYPSVYVGGYPAIVQYAGITAAGLWQINLSIPAQVPNGDQLVVVLLNGIETQPLATVPVAN